MPIDPIQALVEKARKLAENPRTRLLDLLAHIEHPDPRVRSAFLEALWDFPCEATLHSLLLAARSDPEPSVQAAAATSLGRYIWSGMQVDEALDEEFGLDEGVTLEEVDRARACLHELVGDSRRSREVRLRALEALSYDPDPATEREIEALWQCEALEAKAEALACMGRTGQQRWREVIVTTLDGEAPELLRAAIDAAGEGCVDPAEPRLLELACGDDKEVSLAAIWALRNVVHTSAGRHALEKLRRSRDPDIKRSAKAALEELDAVDVELKPERNDKGRVAEIG